ncbi:hypothetical protein [Puniceibacterium confluentis]|uniref:hypothetical protein n=1 Tax=Puniceibacterium confluentis TaxID=1958944 RepID=UPI0011B848D9|nr:hypothetical protein [Puniceibacterium confluentis]
MKLVFLLALTLLMACNTGGPGFRGIVPVERQVDGSRFLLRVNGPLVEAIRINPEAFPAFHDIVRKAGIAAQEVTGCTPQWARGDPALVVLGLACEGAPAPPKPRRRAGFTCNILDTYATPPRRPRDLTLDCYRD